MAPDLHVYSLQGVPQKTGIIRKLVQLFFGTHIFPIILKYTGFKKKKKNFWRGKQRLVANVLFSLELIYYFQ